MTHRECLACLVIGTMVADAPAQSAAGGFTWKQGQVLVYRIEQATSVSEVVDGEKVETSDKHSNVKCWKVLNVDGEGVATLQLWLKALRIERKTPKGEVLLFDSAKPDQSTPQMREQLSKFVGQTLAVLRVDSTGKVVEVKHSSDTSAGNSAQAPPTNSPPGAAVKHSAPASAGSYESSPPFVITLAGREVQPGQTWERAYTLTLEPSQGTGEKCDAVQKYVCKSADGKTASIGFTTTVKSPPMALSDQVPLLKLQPEGEAVFDTVTGCLRSARFQIDKELKDHEGEGSSYHFQTTYTEQLIEDN